jgi:hypothetical protein
MTLEPSVPDEPWRQRRVRARVALAVAVVSDAVQILLVPAFIEGWFSPANDVLDALVAILMIGLLGWHVAFLPSFIAELVPVLGLFPTWTIAVLFVTRGQGRRSENRSKNREPTIENQLRTEN